MTTSMHLAPSSAVKSQSHVPTTEDISLHMPLVRQVVARCMRRLPPSVGRDELMSAGTEGLFDALRKGGADQGIAFQAYDRTRIHGAIVDELRTRDWLSRKERKKATLAAQTGSVPPPALVSFDDLAASFDGVGDGATSALDQLEALDDSSTLTTAVASLPDRERMVVEAYYLRDVPLTDVATKLGVSLARASQLRARAIGKLRLVLQEAAATAPTMNAA